MDPSRLRSQHVVLRGRRLHHGAALVTSAVQPERGAERLFLQRRSDRRAPGNIYRAYLRLVGASHV